VQFNFRGKSGKFHKIAVDDPRLARIIEHCRDLPGQELFQYLDEEGNVQSVGSQDVNEYLREAAGREVSTKNFRTWAGSLYVASKLAREENPANARRIAEAVREAAQRLGNTPAICRKSYVHPRVLDPETWRRPARHAKAPRGLRADEARLLAIIAASASPLRASRSRRLRPTRSSASPRAAAHRP